MRRQLADNGWLPLLLHVYGLRPWELQHLTGRELDALTAEIRRLMEKPDGQ